MYQAEAIVTGTDMRPRPWGFAQTLREVLVKSSGDPRLKDDPTDSNFRFLATVSFAKPQYHSFVCGDGSGRLRPSLPLSRRAAFLGAEAGLRADLTAQLKAVPL
jgi:hypothetical protein